jgi:hypothetical protein
MKRLDYPWLFRVADAASATAQKAHFRTFFVQLLIFATVALLSLLQGQINPSPTVAKWLNTATAVLLVIGIIAILVTRERRYEKRWFDARAVAESSKTITWRYVMHIPPFDIEGANAKFIEELRAIELARPTLTAADAKEEVVEQISARMEELRNSNFALRKQVYTSTRAEDQKEWYVRNARKNSQTASVWFWTTLGLQVVALIFAILKADGLASFSPAGLIMTVAAGAAAWNQAKRHDELSASYSLAAHELADLKTLLVSCSDENAFVLLVEDIEEAISREHTMWRARRNVRR